MKTLFFAMTLILSALPALADDAKPTPLEACKAKAAFLYHFDMMKIEGEEIRKEITHDQASERKQSRHLQFSGETAACSEQD